jgi:hypothetical protein
LVALMSDDYSNLNVCTRGRCKSVVCTTKTKARECLRK